AAVRDPEAPGPRSRDRAVQPEGPAARHPGTARSREGRRRLLARHAAGRADGDPRAHARDEGRWPAAGGTVERGRRGRHPGTRAHPEGLSLHRQGPAPGSRGTRAGRGRSQEPRPDRRLRGERRELRARPEPGRQVERVQAVPEALMRRAPLALALAIVLFAGPARGTQGTCTVTSSIT